MRSFLASSQQYKIRGYRKDCDRKAGDEKLIFHQTRSKAFQARNSLSS
jgi:hypothetical protein